MPLYFAYGSNMDRTAMAARCPASRPLGSARLQRHKFVINSDGYATIVHEPRSVVHGVLYDLALSDVAALDRYEDLARGLYRKVIQPVLTDAGPRRAMVYIGRSSEPGPPRPGYLESVVAAARQAGLPLSYIAEIEGKPAPQGFRAIGRKTH